MKKIFSFAAILFAAMSLNAQESITCAEAVAKMPLQPGSETETVYTITGYVTNTNGAINSSHQQTFWMDDEKGTKKTFQGYLGILPAEENTPLNLGDKVSLTGKIKNYNNAPEIEKGQVVILERSTVKIDTIDATVCEALEEGASLNDKDYSAEVFRVYGRVKGTESVNSYGAHTFEMACGDQVFKPYNCTSDEAEFGKGDSVVVIGKLYNFGGVIEISGGRIELIKKSQEEIVINEVNVAGAVAAAMELAQGATSDDFYAVTGYVDSIATAYSEQYGNISFFMTDDMANPTYDFEAFRVKVTAEEAALITIGRKVTVTAALQHYYKAATETLPEIDLAETVAGGAIEIHYGEGIENTADETKALKRIEDGQVVIIRNGVRYNALGAKIER